jgi:fused signal recognition particle receptor
MGRLAIIMDQVAIALIVGAVVALVVIGFVLVPRRRPPVDEQTPDKLAERLPRVESAPADEHIEPPRQADMEEGAATPGLTGASGTVDVPPAPTVPEAEPGAPGLSGPPTPPGGPPAPATAFERFRTRLGRTRRGLGASVASILRRGLDDDVWEELEEALIGADVGVAATTDIVERLRAEVHEQGVRTGDDALALLKDMLREELAAADRSLRRRRDGTTVWLVTGVNGTGKTTSIGKLAARHTREGEAVVLAAADTFRAAAAEQLELWGQRSRARVVRQEQGADPAAVAFDGRKAAEAAGADLLIVDTAGRLQNKTQLMAELSKVKRVLEREGGACDEVLLVLDATTGQNGLSQARAFMDAVDVTGVVLTKLDGTAKGGIVVAIQRELGLPVKLIGIGEGVDDLTGFDPDAFVEALFAQGEQDVEPESGSPVPGGG